jgi:hypothetical protein
MKLEEDLWSQHQYQVLVSFVHHLAYYRVLRRFYVDLKQDSEFWTRTINAHLLRAVIDWCMVFGTDSNQIHWKRVAADENAQQDFRRFVLDVASLTQDELDTYWSKMTIFRNDFAAHKIVASNYPAAPDMDTALVVATAYDDWLRQAVNAAFDEPSLQGRYDRLMRTTEESLRQLISLGPTLEQEYESRPPRNPRF